MSRTLRDARVALVHDWLVAWGGAECVLESLAGLFPDAPIYTSVWDPSPPVEEAFGGREIRTSFVQRIPGSGSVYRYLFPLMPRAFGSLDLSGFDLVISSSYGFSKAVRTGPDTVHLCYCHTPPRYLWDLRDFYNPGLRGVLRAPLIRWLQAKDRAAARGVDRYVANSRNVRGRIDRVYGREATVVYPPVGLDRLRPSREPPEDFFVAGGRLVGYKRIDLAVEAANRTGMRLAVFGDGPERRALERLAGPTVRMLGRIGDDELADLLARCRGLLFPGEEDFGILPLEAQAAGRPVVARADGGATETVVDGVTGVLWDPDEGIDGFIEAMRELERREWDPAACRTNAERFAAGRFEEEMTEVCRMVLTEEPARPAGAAS